MLDIYYKKTSNSEENLIDNKFKALEMFMNNLSWLLAEKKMRIPAAMTISFDIFN